MKKPTLILVEDENQQRESLAMIFESEGYDIHSFPSAEEVCDKLQTIMPQLIISDVKLPGMDGFTFFDKVRGQSQYHHIPFIFITGYNDPEAIKSVKKLGAAAYVTKPYELEDLITRVQQILPVKP
jgi:two-component system, NtrC family, nitrogen regulation response regulator GlnG